MPRPWSRPYRILHILPDLEVGGGQMLLLQNILATDKTRFRHFVSYVRPIHTLREQFEAAGVTSLPLDVRGRAGHPVALLRLLRFASRHRIGLVHTNNTQIDLQFGAALSWLRGIPLINSLHSELPPHFRPNWRRRLSYRIARKRLHSCIAVSDLAGKSWTPCLRRAGIDHGRIKIINPRIELSRFSHAGDGGNRAPVRKELGLNESTPVLVNVARLVPGKGHALLLKVFSRIRAACGDAALLLIGDGPLRADLAQAAKEAGVGDSVRFLGYRHDIPQLLSAADIFVFPSEYEGFGIAPLEAMAAGIPVVAFELPTLRQFVGKFGAGFLVPQGDVNAMAEAVLRLVEDRELAGRMGKSGRRAVASHYRMDGRQLEHAYESALSEHNRQRSGRSPSRQIPSCS